MTAERGDDQRVVMPRWRTWRRTDRSGELRPLRSTNPPPANTNTNQLIEPSRNFRQYPGFHSASDAISTALILKSAHTDTSADAFTDAYAAAHYVLGRHQTAPEAVVFIAKALLGNPSQTEEPPNLTYAELGQRVALLRSILIREPRNMVRWVDIALAFTAGGHPGRAQRAMTVALGLAGTNRFVLRAANRFAIHLNDFDGAADLLTRDAARLDDPWLLSAEIATQTLRGRTSAHLKRARRVLDRGGFSPWHVGELATAVATVDIMNGDNRTARKLLRLALREPTENAAAQAEWSAPDLIEGTQLNLPLGYEVRARHAAREQQWGDAVEFGLQWLLDQPFSLDAASHTSFIASVEAEDYPNAEKASELGLRTNPDSIVLRNNLAFALANQMKLTEAKKQLERASAPTATPHERSLLLATEGLVAFRCGDLVSGRRLYRAAAEGFQDDPMARALCLTYWAREEIATRSENAAEVISRAESAHKVGGSGEVGRLLDRVRVMAEGVIRLSTLEARGR